MKRFPILNEEGNIVPKVRNDLKESGTSVFLVDISEFEYVEEKGNVAIQIGVTETTEEPIYWVIEPKVRVGQAFTKKSTTKKTETPVTSYKVEL